MNEKVSIIGGGSWGTSLAQLLAKKGYSVLLYLRNEKLVNNINTNHCNSKYFPDKKISENIKATNSLKKAISFASIVFLAVPTYATRNTMSSIEMLLRGNQLIVSTAKGYEEKTFLRNSEIISEYTNLPVAILSGPTHAEEVINHLPTAAVVSCKDIEIAKKIQELLISPKFRVYTNPDLIGVEIGGAIKNVIAIASGIADGLGYGDNTKSALITRGLNEMSRFGVYHGAELFTFAGLAGLGDLVVTCTSMHSRNYRLGTKIGKEYSLKEALSSVKQTVEGVKTTRAIYKWFKEKTRDFDIPITKEIYHVLFQNKSPIKAVDDLMLRGAKHESQKINEKINC